MKAALRCAKCGMIFPAFGGVTAASGAVWNYTSHPCYDGGLGDAERIRFSSMRQHPTFPGGAA